MTHETIYVLYYDAYDPPTDYGFTTKEEAEKHWADSLRDGFCSFIGKIRVYKTSEEAATVWLVTDDKSGESDGPFPTYEAAKAHRQTLLKHTDPDSIFRYFIEEASE
ncbi:MAG: hypothetical protein CL581_09515 [Alteromonadaceae bacterium]|jgi:hypothetical protein|nr:hypothetical protein [Alteromonadaceae bacterium]|tara:strand:+ start:200 stop:520 length:321 start_codon:yes stop_codon:yes gene_type:complete